MPAPALVRLPGGLWHSSGGTQPLREVRLRPVRDEDRAFLLESLDVLPAAERATALLARCVICDGDEPVVDELTVGDREALLLNLHRLTFGETMDCILRCPAPDCGKQMELSPRVADLLLSPYETSQPRFEWAALVAGSDFRVVFRLPAAADLTGVAVVASRDSEQGALALLGRCVLAATRDGVPVDVDALPSDVRDSVASEMARNDPQAELELDASCPACGTQFTVMLDAASYLLQMLDAQATQVLREVHVLASQYGWSEADILRMSASRRVRYLDLIAESRARARGR